MPDYLANTSEYMQAVGTRFGFQEGERITDPDVLREIFNLPTATAEETERARETDTSAPRRQWWNIWNAVPQNPDGTCPAGHHKNAIGVCIPDGEYREGLQEVSRNLNPAELIPRVATIALGGALIVVGLLLSQRTIVVSAVNAATKGAFTKEIK